MDGFLATVNGNTERNKIYLNLHFTKIKMFFNNFPVLILYSLDFGKRGCFQIPRNLLHLLIYWLCLLLKTQLRKMLDFFIKCMLKLEYVFLDIFSDF